MKRSGYITIRDYQKKYGGKASHSSHQYGRKRNKENWCKTYKRGLQDSHVMKDIIMKAIIMKEKLIRKYGEKIYIKDKFKQTSASCRQAWYVMFEVDRSIMLCHAISPSLPSRSSKKCSRSFSVTSSFSWPEFPVMHLHNQ